MEELPIKKENIYIRQQFLSSKDYFEKMVSKFEREGLVKEGYYDSIINREEIYPTGLYTGKINIAIPHTDYQFSNTTAIVITTLEDSLTFKRMDDPDESVEVKVIIHLLFDNPDKQPKLLQKLMSLVTNQSFLEEIVLADNSLEIEEIFKKQN